MTWKKEKFTQAKVVNQHPAMHSTIHLPTQTRGKTMQSVNAPLSRIPSRIHLFSGKIISFAALKKTGINVEVRQLDEKIFVRLSRLLEMVNWKAYRKDINFLQNNPNSNGYLGKNPNVSECTAHNIFQSTLSLWASNLRLRRAL